ncbi:MAG: glycosyltransferase [Opitutae bacterium]|nr:glycosyltransferase [Opitutae bacterium]
MPKNYTLSVVVPTYNCASLIARHIASMQNWLDLADEIIVVDSQSTDGTNELIRQNLNLPMERTNSFGKISTTLILKLLNENLAYTSLGIRRLPQPLENGFILVPLEMSLVAST